MNLIILQRRQVFISKNQHQLKMQILTMLFAATLASCVALESFMLGSCKENIQCHQGYFCETSSRECLKCLSCQDLKREPPPLPNSCIKSVTECGPCLKGLVADHQSDLNCLPPETTADGASSDTAVWVTVGIVVVFILIAAAIVAYYISRSKNKSKMPVGDLENTNTSTTSHFATAPAASAPESPPPYSSSFDQPSYQPISEKARRGSDEDRPLIPLNQPPEYESQTHQKVSMFNKPNYVNYHTGFIGSNLPPAALPTANGHSYENGNNSPPQHDEDTMPSDWTSTPQHQNDIDAGPAVIGATSPSAQPQCAGGESAAAANLATALAIARNTELIRSHPETLQLQPLDGREEARSGNDSSSYNVLGASARPSNNNNIFLNVNIVNK